MIQILCLPNGKRIMVEKNTKHGGLCVHLKFMNHILDYIMSRKLVCMHLRLGDIFKKSHLQVSLLWWYIARICCRWECGSRCLVELLPYEAIEHLCIASFQLYSKAPTTQFDLWRKGFCTIEDLQTLGDTWHPTDAAGYSADMWTCEGYCLLWGQIIPMFTPELMDHADWKTAGA